MSQAVRISRVDVISVMTWAGWKSVGKWDNARLAERLPQIKDVLPEGQPGDEKTAAALVDILAGLEKGATFEIFNPEGVTSPEADTKPAKTEEEKAAEKKKTEEEKAAKAESKKAEREAKKAAKKAEREAAKAAKSKKGLSRGYFAGVVMKKYGCPETITEQMIAEVDALYGKPNSVVSKGALGWAQDALQGYHAVEVVPNASESPAAAPAAASAAASAAV
jgi:hypothetical protein